MPVERGKVMAEYPQSFITTRHGTNKVLYRIFTTVPLDFWIKINYFHL
jgi:hypothetical protein